MPINKLSIQGIRGIRNKIEIMTDGRSIMIHGPNGSGKSSIERALRWVLTGQEKPTDEPPFTTESSFRRHVLVDANFPSVEVVFSDESSIEVTTDSATYSGNAQSAVNAIKKSPPFLRRTELLDVLSSRPVDRFQYFESFLALEDVDATIQSVDTNLQELNEQQVTLNQRIQYALDAMRPLLPEGRREAVISISTLEEEAMNTLVYIGLIKEKSSWENALTAIKAVSGVKSEESLLLLRSQLTELASTIESLSNRILEDFSFPEAIEEKRKVLEPTTADADKNELIQHAVLHFKANEGDRCPVCNSIIDWEKTKETLIQRLEALTEYLKLVDERDKASKDLLTILNEFLVISSRLVQLLGSENKKIKSVTSYLGDIELITSEERNSPEQILALIAYGGSTLLDHLRKV
ncbi:AAA family ATPase, partial [bacterium]|nr:AAA family ATPase [bacterium]